MTPEFDWTQSRIERLEALWAEGVSAKEIGDQLGCSKNAVVGKAHRRDLPGRPSPIKGHVSKPRQPRMRRKPGALKAIRELRTLEPHAEYKPPPKPGVFTATTFRPMDHWAPIDPALARQLNEARRIAPRPALTPGAHVGAAKSCQFPSWGDDEKPTHIYCGEPVERDESGAPTGSYCSSCRSRCYTRTRRQEWAA